MKELKKRIMSTHNQGLACGPIDQYVIDAEIVVDDEGYAVYLHGQWLCECGDSVVFEAHTVSLYDVYKKVNRVWDDLDKVDTLLGERDRLQEEKSVTHLFGNIDVKKRYAAQYKKMLKMIQKQIDKDEIGVDLMDEMGYGED